LCPFGDVMCPWFFVFLEPCAAGFTFEKAVTVPRLYWLRREMSSTISLAWILDAVSGIFHMWSSTLLLPVHACWRWERYS
jgi:hypothetical protein